MLMINAGSGVARLCAQPLAHSPRVSTTATTLAALSEAKDFHARSSRGVVVISMRSFPSTALRASAPLRMTGSPMFELQVCSQSARNDECGHWNLGYGC
jgi:hypothetical protein